MTANASMSTNQSLNPGPGSYLPPIHKFSKQPQYGFGTSQRVGVSKSEAAPGPGAYDLICNIHNIYFSTPQWAYYY